MSIGMNDLMLLVGRLDDAAGFDTPRERFRRFLVERVTDARVAGSILDDCQRSIGEQPHRILQDTVVLLGRFLGFETTFGTYQRVAGTLKMDGQWRSRGRLHIVLEIRSDQMRSWDLESLERSLAAVAVAAHPEPAASLGLCVVARQYAGRAKLDAAHAADGRNAGVRVVSVRSLVWLAEATSAGHLRHEDVLRIMKSGVDLDFMVDLLERMTGQLPQVPQLPAPQPSFPSEQGFWVTTITGSDSAAPEQLLTAVIGQRRILGVTYPGPRGGGAPGDWVCLFVPGRGIVGHAQLASIIERRAGVVRHSERFSRVFGLDNVELYDDPIVPPPGTEQTFTPGGNGGGAPLAGPYLVPITREEFVGLTSWQEPANFTADPLPSAQNADALLT